MYSKNIDFHSFINDLTKYIREKNLDITDTPILDILIENPDMQRLISIWLQTKNDSQLNYLLLQTVDKVSKMPPEEQNQALSGLLEQAKFLNSKIPTPSDLDIVLESMGEAETETWDGWSDFNLPLAELSQTDMKKLQHHVFFINAGVFTANVVAGMSIAETAAFDARVDAIIKEHADFILPDRVFSDKLVALLKSDLIIREILAGVKAIQPVVTPLKRQRLGSEEVNEDLLAPSFVTSIERQGMDSEDLTDSADDSAEVSADLLAQYLGLDNDESTVDTYTDDDSLDREDSTENISSISGATTAEDLDLDISREKPASSTLTFWQSFNIEAHDLYELIRIGEINPHDIPDRELTDKETAIYLFMNRLMHDLKPGLQDMQKKESVTPARRESISPQSSLGSTVTSNISSYRSSNSTAYEYPTVEPRRFNKKDSRDKFIPVIKDTTHNIDYKERNRNQRKIDYVGKEGTGMPRWHREYKERMQQRQNRSSEAEDTKASNSRPKPPTKFGKY